jgi:hypothetical protein
VFLERFDEFGRGAWIALVVVSFWLWWPLGLGALAYLAFARRRGSGGPGRWYSAPDGAGAQAGAAWGPGSGWGGVCGGRTRAAPPSGNKAFDEYRAETLRRLEEEQREFLAYLERLRQARDKSEFDSFMADRRNRQTPQPMPEQG